METEVYLLPKLLPGHKCGTPQPCEIPHWEAGTPEPTRTADLRFRKPSTGGFPFQPSPFFSIGMCG
jgi:hypothetical protein